MDTMNTTTPQHTPETGEGSPSLANFTIQKLERERDEAREWQNVKVTKNGETHCLGTLIDLLERERDEALAKLSTVYRWIERNHSDGFIDSQSHLENLDRVADAWHDKLEDMQRELSKTRDQLKAMREAIKEAYGALEWTTKNMNPPFEWEPFTRANATLTKLQPFIKP